MAGTKKYCYRTSGARYVRSGYVYNCGGQSNCAAYGSSCISGYRKICSVASGGYYLSGGRPNRCRGQSYCSSSQTSSTCVGSYFRCSSGALPLYA